MTKIMYKGRELPCRVTMGAMVRFKREAGRDVSAIESGDIADLILFFWCCIKSACNADGETFDEPFERFADSLDSDALQGFVESLTAQGGDAEQKKTPETK